MVFFVKQKTAYEMRISDWSSDVCSSDLAAPPGRSRTAPSACRGRGGRRTGARRCLALALRRACGGGLGSGGPHHADEIPRSMGKSGWTGPEWLNRAVQELSRNSASGTKPSRDAAWRCGGSGFRSYGDKLSLPPTHSIRKVRERKQPRR